MSLLTAFVLLAGCGVPGQAHPTQLANNDVRVVQPSTATSFPRGTRTRRVEVCLVAGDHLTATSTQIPIPVTVTRALDALGNAAGTSLPDGTRTAIGPNLVTAKHTTRGVAEVDLNADFSQLPAADQILALAQVVCTLTSLPGIGQVHFTSNGKPVDIPRADSSLTNAPVARADYMPLLPASSR